MRTRSAWLFPVLLLGLLCACEDSGAPPRVGGGGSNGGGSTGGGGNDGAGDGGANGGGPCGFPIGEYAYVSTDDGGSDCSQFTLPAAEIIYTQSHTFVPVNVELGSCTVTATDIVPDGCTIAQSLTCSDGSSASVTCVLNTTGSVLTCDASAMAGGLGCTTSFRAERTASRACNAPLGVYAIEVSSLTSGDATGCVASSTQEQELEAFLDLLLRARGGCTWNRPSFDAATCAYAREGTCVDGVGQPFATCTFSNDATTGTCDFDDGQCAYQLTLLR